MVRIISGSARGRILKSPQGMATRPTLDRTRESLFNILATSSFYEKRVLDIFAGTGALGLEAMSRGASEGVFIDVRTASLVKKNAELCKVSERCKVLPLNHKNALQHLEGQTFDYIFADPPYDKDLVNETISTVMNYGLLSDTGLLIMEHSAREDIMPSESYTVVREKKYGKETRISFIVKRRNGE